LISKSFCISSFIFLLSFAGMVFGIDSEGLCKSTGDSIQKKSSSFSGCYLMILVYSNVSFWLFWDFSNISNYYFDFVDFIFVSRPFICKFNCSWFFFLKFGNNYVGSSWEFDDLSYFTVWLLVSSLLQLSISFCWFSILFYTTSSKPNNSEMSFSISSLVSLVNLVFISFFVTMQTTSAKRLTLYSTKVFSWESKRLD